MKISKLMLQDFSSNAELRLHASNTEDVGSISSQRAKIPHVTGQKKKKKRFRNEGTKERDQSALKILLWEMLWLINLLRLQDGLVSLTG